MDKYHVTVTDARGVHYICGDEAIATYYLYGNEEPATVYTAAEARRLVRDINPTLKPTAILIAQPTD